MAIGILEGYEPRHEARTSPSSKQSVAGQTVNLFAWHQFKQFLEHASGVSMDALHILVGFLIFILVAHLSRRSIASPLPWFALLILELANEAYDLHVELWPDRPSQLGEGAKDIFLTMALPTLLMLLARIRPALLGRKATHIATQSTTR